MAPPHGSGLLCAFGSIPKLLLFSIYSLSLGNPIRHAYFDNSLINVLSLDLPTNLLNFTFVYLTAYATPPTEYLSKLI